MNSPFFSIVIPVFNRDWSLERAVDSAIGFAGGMLPVEIVLVDDASTDNSERVIEQVRSRYRDVPGILFRFIQHPSNKGVCAAKNSGARAASGKWLVFLDSDDELIVGRAAHVAQALIANEMYPLHFFKCIDEESEVTDASDSTELRNFETYFNRGTDGEALPVADRLAFLAYPYDEDLRGYESLAYLRMVRKFSFAVIHSLVVRRYYTSHEERLSSRRGMARRYRDLAKGNLRVLREHSSAMTSGAYLRQCARLLKYKILSRFPHFLE